MTKIILTSTVPQSLNCFCRGWLFELKKEGYEVVAVSSPGSELQEVEMREGVKTYAVSMYRHISPLKDLRSLCSLIRIFRKERPQMVHSITPKAGLLSMMAAWVSRVPVRVHTFTGLVFPTSVGLKREILKLTDRLTCFFATHIIPEGEGVRSDLISNKITKKPLKVLGYGNVRGIDLDHYDPNNAEVCEKARILKKSGLFTFVYVGRLVRDKGVNELVTAFKRLNGENAGTRLLLVGDIEDKLDPLDADVLSEIESNPSIEYAGYQEDVRGWLSASDVMVFPSYREGFPNAVIEAGAMGLPSIVTNINGSNEIVIEGENGIIVPPGSADALYAAMKECLENRQKRAAMSLRARKLIADRFEQSFVRNCQKAYYREILKSVRLQK